MVQIRKLQPSVGRIALPPSDKLNNWSKANTRRQIQSRKLADYPPGTPQPTPCRLWQGAADKGGYGRRKMAGQVVLMHRWVVEKIEGRRLRKDEVVMHRCDNPPCYRYDHLEVGTIQTNNEDRHRKGRTKQTPQYLHGANNGRSKLTAGQVAEIRIDYDCGVGIMELARRYGVSKVTIRRIVDHQTWRTDKERAQLDEEREKRKHAHREVDGEGTGQHVAPG